MNKTVGSYQDYLAYRQRHEKAPSEMERRLSNLSVNSIIAQWVPATDAESAEKSFFKINQAATPIDPTERRILKARRSASAIAARAIIHAGTGHRYWIIFDKEKQQTVETAGRAIYQALYDPPLSSMPLTTLDVPVAGRGYNALPFIFDLVNQANGLNIADTTTRREIEEELPADSDGNTTIAYLNAVQIRVEKITTDDAGSLGLHPVVYFYTRSGAFQPIAFLAMSNVVEDLAKRRKLMNFTRVRRDFEEFIIIHKEAVSLLIHKFGSGGRSLPWLEKYYITILEGLWAGKSIDDVRTVSLQTPISLI